MTARNDPKLYTELNKPFASMDEANAASAAFFEELAELRKKHRIANLVVLAKVSMLADEGDGAPFEVEGMSSLLLGDSRAHLPMLAHAFGAEQNAEQERTARIIAAAKRGGWR